MLLYDTISNVLLYSNVEICSAGVGVLDSYTMDLNGFWFPTKVIKIYE